MKDFLKKALSTLVVLDDTKPEVVVRPAAPVGARPVFRSVAVPVSEAQASANAGMPVVANGTIRIPQDVIEKFETYFMELFQRMDMPGPDYYEFWQACESLEDAIPDVRARMKAAFKMLQKQGLAKDVLISTANQYIDGIAADVSKYRLAVDATRKHELGGKSQELEATQQSIAGDLLKIEELERGIADRKKRIDQLTDEIAASERRIESNAAGYDAACQAMTAKIKEDIANITTIL